MPSFSSSSWPCMRSVRWAGCPGTFTEKKVKGDDYLYFQVSQPGGTTKQFYLGRKSPALQRIVTRFARERIELRADLDRLRRLTAQLRAGGVNTTDAPSGRVLRSLSDSGLFEAGAVLLTRSRSR
jgi:hypothetical protein